MLQYCTYSLLLTFIFFIIEHFNTINSSVYKILPLVCIAIGFIYFIKTQFTNKFNKPSSRLAHVYFGSAHVCFGLLVYFQSLFLKSISAISIAFTQELTVLILAHGLLLFKQYKLGDDGGEGGEAPLLWQYALFALPISLAVLIGLLGLKATSLIDASLVGLLTPVASIGLSVLCGVETFKPRSTLGFIIMLVGFLIYYL